VSVGGCQPLLPFTLRGTQRPCGAGQWLEHVAQRHERAKWPRRGLCCGVLLAHFRHACSVWLTLVEEQSIPQQVPKPNSSTLNPRLAIPCTYRQQTVASRRLKGRLLLQPPLQSSKLSRTRVAARMRKGRRPSATGFPFAGARPAVAAATLAATALQSRHAVAVWGGGKLQGFPLDSSYQVASQGRHLLRDNLHLWRSQWSKRPGIVDGCRALMRRNYVGVGVDSGRP
jgi:hypothetical protein